MRTIGEQFQEALAGQAVEAGNLMKMMSLLKDSGLYDEKAHVSLQTYSFSRTDPPYLKISPWEPGDLAGIARKLLPVVGKLEKGFDGDQGHITLTATYLGIRVVLWDDVPKTCTVEKFEEEVNVPEQIVPAHTEKKVRYRLVGDCNPVLADEGTVQVDG